MKEHGPREVILPIVTKNRIPAQCPHWMVKRYRVNTWAYNSIIQWEWYGTSTKPSQRRIASILPNIDGLRERKSALHASNGINLWDFCLSNIWAGVAKMIPDIKASIARFGEALTTSHKIAFTELVRPRQTSVHCKPVGCVASHAGGLYNTH